MQNHSLDPASVRILDELQKNSELSTAELAERVGLSQTPCWRRQKELEENGYIKRYAAIVDRRKVGLMVCCHAHVSPWQSQAKDRYHNGERYLTFSQDDYSIVLLE